VKMPPTFAETIKTRGNILLVKKLPRTQTAGGILLTDQQKVFELDLFRIVYIGPGKYNLYSNSRVEIDLRVGQLVLANPQAALTYADWTSQELYMLSEGEVFGVISPEGESLYTAVQVEKIEQAAGVA